MRAIWKAHCHTANNPLDRARSARFVDKSLVEAYLPDAVRILYQNHSGVVTESRNKGHLEERGPSDEGHWCLTVRGLDFCMVAFGL